MPVPYQESSLWLRTLGSSGETPAEVVAIERLRGAYVQFRNVVEKLAGEIASSMSMFTDHSIEHCDALWETASLIAGDDYKLNPAEAFVLGGSFLLHDLGMGLSAYPDGGKALEKDPLYLDLLESNAEKVRKQKKVKQLDDQVTASLAMDAMVSLLRRRHARQAEALVQRDFKTGNSDSLFLLEDTELRHSFGPLIGRIAHSHWMDVNDLPNAFNGKTGAQAYLPAGWEVDPLKIACLLRLADAAQIDSRRASTYLCFFREVGGESKNHWTFQERMARPRADEDRITFSSNRPFTADEAASWWLCFETVQMIEREVRKVDALCADAGIPRMKIRGVSGAESPTRFAESVPVEAWTPIDAKLKVGSVSSLVKTLGGESLYGDRPMIAVRELIANGTDAVRARVAQYGVPNASVTIRFVKENDHTWLEVQDSGLGMSPSRMLSCLTDFGASGWTSEETLSEYPGLVSKGYKSTGKFGIGFFSVFMLADHVEVRSLKYREASRDTKVLVFDSGFESRPLMRDAKEEEQVDIGGTLVRARLRHAPNSEDGLAGRDLSMPSFQDWFVRRLKSMCALLEFDLYVHFDSDEEPIKIIDGGFWKVATANELFNLVYVEELAEPGGYSLSWPKYEPEFAERVQDLKNDQGDVAGRAALGLVATESTRGIWWITPYAKIFVGGLEAGRIYGMLGAFTGEPLKADRENGFPDVSIAEFRSWADSQIAAVPKRDHSTRQEMNVLDSARSLGVDLSDRTLAFTSTGSIDPRDISAWISARDVVYLIPFYELNDFVNADGKQVFRDYEQGFKVDIGPDALVMNVGGGWIFPDEVLEPPRDERFVDFGELRHDEFNPLHWWHHHGRLGAPAVLITKASEAWSTDPTLVAQNFDYLRVTTSGDYRLELKSLESEDYVKVDAFRLTRPTGPGAA